MPNRYPGPESRALLEELSSYVVVEPYPFAVDLSASRGMQLATVDGQRITDWTGLYGSKLIGYNHPRMFEPTYLNRLAVASATKLPNPDFLTRECLDYYRLLRSIAPKCMRNDRLEVYAVNSGAEAVENIRGLGLYQGFTLKEPGRQRRLIDDALEHENLLLLGAGPGHIRLRPPLDVTESDIDHLIGALERLLERQA